MYIDDIIAHDADGGAFKVRSYKGVAFTYHSQQTEPGETEVTCWECGGDGRGPNASVCECADGCDHCECMTCCGTGIVHDEEPEPAPTGRVLMVMVGDDYKHAIDPDDVYPIEPEDYCHGCGQIGCTHDAYPRGDDNQ